MSEESTDQNATVFLALHDVPGHWEGHFHNLSTIFAEVDTEANAVAECRRLLAFAEDEPWVTGLLNLLLAQALLSLHSLNSDRTLLLDAVDAGYGAQRLLAGHQNRKLWAISEYNLGIAYETIADVGPSDEALAHLKDAALHFDRACQVFESNLLAEGLYRLATVQRQIGGITFSPDAFLDSRNSFRMAATIYADVQLPRREIDALYNSAEVDFRHGATVDSRYAVEAMRTLMGLVERNDVPAVAMLDIKSLLAQALIVASIPHKHLNGLQQSTNLLQEVAQAHQFEADPWRWLTAQFNLADACLKLVMWTIQWEADTSKLDTLLQLIAATADMAIDRCGERFLEHQRELMGVKLAAFGVYLARFPAGEAGQLLAKFRGFFKDLKSLELTNPSARRESLNQQVSTIAMSLHRKDWHRAIEHATELLTDVEPNGFFLKPPGTVLGELRSLASIGHMAAYAYLMLGDEKAALELSEASKSRFMQLAISMDSFSGENTSAREFRAAREDWFRVGDQLILLDEDLSKAKHAQHVPELLDQKRSLARDFGAISHRLTRLLAQVPIPIVPELNMAALAGTLADDCVVVSIIVTDAGGAGIFFQVQDFAPRTILFPELTSGAVQELFAPRSAVGGWLASYETFRQASEAAGSTLTMRELNEWSDTVMSLGARLWTLFLGPLHEHLKGAGLPLGASIKLILPGLLGALPISAAWRMDNGRRRFVIEDWTLASVPSIHSLMTAQRLVVNEQHFGRDLLLVGASNPFNAPFGETDANPISVPEAGFLTAIDALCSDRFSYWSFGCHGYWDSDNPRQSRLIVSLDEALTVADLQRQKFRSCRLALLGACESSFFDPSGALAEQIGIPAALVEAGVAGVVGTLWLIAGPVEDFLARVLDRHLKGETPASSLRAEQLILIDRMADIAASETALPAISVSRFGTPVELQPAVQSFDPALPAFWAAFQLTGV